MKLPEITPVFNHNSRLNKHGEGKIHIRIYFNKRKLIATGISIETRHWDEKLKKVKNHERKDFFNRVIKKLCRQYEENAEQLLLIGKPFGVDDILSFHEKETQKVISFTAFIKQNLNSRSNLRPGTIKNHKVLFNRLEEFSTVIEFTDINYPWLCNFESFLRNYTFTKNTEIRKLKLTRIKKYFSDLHAYINQAIKNGYLQWQDDPFKMFDMSAYNKAVRQANQIDRGIKLNELENIKNLTFDGGNKHLEYIRDFFVFQCYTGLNYTDVIKLTADNLEIKYVNGKKGYVINTIRTKSNERVYIPLFLMNEDGHAESLISKYLDTNKTYIFDFKTSEYINRQLKVIGKMAKIKKNLSSGAGRHTLAQLLYDRGLHREDLKAILGQNRANTTAIYALTKDNNIDQAFINLERKKG